MKTRSIVEDASYHQLMSLLAALIFLFFILGLFSARSPGFSPGLQNNYSEVGASFVSSRGAVGGFILPASCESGFEHSAGECLPPPSGGAGGAGGAGWGGGGG